MELTLPDASISRRSALIEQAIGDRGELLVGQELLEGPVERARLGSQALRASRGPAG